MVVLLGSYLCIKYNCLKIIWLDRNILYYTVISKLVTVVGGDQKAPFSIANYYTKLLGRALLLSLDCSTLPLIRTLYCWVLSKEVSIKFFKVFGMTWPRIEPRSPRPLANTLPTRPMSLYKVKLATVVEGYPKTTFSIATTPRYREVRYSFPRIRTL